MRLATAIISACANLYSVGNGQQAIRDAYRAVINRTGDLSPLPGIIPDQMAPVVRHNANGRELVALLSNFGP